MVLNHDIARCYIYISLETDFEHFSFLWNLNVLFLQKANFPVKAQKRLQQIDELDVLAA